MTLPIPSALQNFYNFGFRQFYPNSTPAARQQLIQDRWQLMGDVLQTHAKGAQLGAGIGFVAGLLSLVANPKKSSVFKLGLKTFYGGLLGAAVNAMMTLPQVVQKAKAVYEKNGFQPPKF